MIHNRPVAPIAAADWPKYADHGTCAKCAQEMVREARKRAEAKRAQKEVASV